MEKTGGLIDLLVNIPVEIRNKIISTYDYEDPTSGRLEVIILYGGTTSTIAGEVEAIGGTFEDLGYGFAIVTINGAQLNNLINIRGIDYIELPKNLYLSFEPSNRASCIIEPRDLYQIYGEGVLVGFIDSGIDYTNEAFRRENGDTRIDYIYDLDAGGAVYTSEDINNALKSGNPQSVVPHVDRVGHGTHVAGIACAGGNIPNRYYGVAPRSSIAMVKMTRASAQANGKSTQLMRGIKFLLDKSLELNKPLSINISFSTNDGAHNGESLLEQYISNVATTRRTTICIAAGNEGGKAHHISGDIEGTRTIQFSVGTGERALILQLYKSLLVDFTVRIIAPNGMATQPLRISNTINVGRVGGNQYFIYNTGPTPFSINGEIIIVLSGVGEVDISNGIWSMELTATNRYQGRFDMWLPVSEGLSENTRFLNPTLSNTVGIPGTVRNIITVGSYNYSNLTISPFSGRGNSELNPVKPDLAAPGENIESNTVDGGFESLSGTSMSTPAVAGACALLMDFGIIKERDPFLYGERVKYYLLQGAERTRVDELYPNNNWGYGTLCLEGAINVWQSEVGTREIKNVIIKENRFYEF